MQWETEKIESDPAIHRLYYDPILIELHEEPLGPFFRYFVKLVNDEDCFVLLHGIIQVNDLNADLGKAKYEVLKKVKDWHLDQMILMEKSLLTILRT